jgi:transcription antitermination factor NusG
MYLCDIPEDQHFEVKKVSGIINLVYWLNKPAVIKDREIQAVREFLDEYKNVRLEKTNVNVNDMVRVLSGPLMEFEGNVIGIKSNTVKIVLPSLGLLMVAEVEKTNVEIVKPNFTLHKERSINTNYAF